MGGVGRSPKPSESALTRQGIEVRHSEVGTHFLCLLFHGGNGLPVCAVRERVNRYVAFKSIIFGRRTDDGVWI